MRKVWVLGLACLLAMGGCGRKAALDEASADAWSKLLIGHTSGVVPRKSEVRVLFAGDVGAEKKLDGTLRVEPAIDGELTLRGTRELVLVPKAALTPGQEYRVTLSPKGLTGVPQDIAPYQFTFHVQTPQYELVLQDLESDPQQDQRMIQRGIIATADAEDAASVEKMLRATFRGNAVTPTWTHAGNGREHSFTLVGIERQQAGETLSLDIDGKAIGAGGSETRSVMVPAIGEFAVVNAVGTEEAGRKQIQISFSDNLDATQDLKGLVQLSDGGFTTRIEGNRILLYPADDPEGQLTVTVEAGVRNRRNEKLAQTWTQTLTLASQKPQVRFVGNGVVLPDAKQLTVPFEAVSARSVQVIATRVFPENIPQFLQVNALGGNYDIGRVGRYLWRKTLALTGPSTGLWQRYEIDVTELMQRYPGALIQLTLQLTPPDSAYTCQGGTELQPANVKERGLVDQEDNDSRMDASWEYSGEYFGVAEDGGEVDWDARWRDRKDPCRNAYYLFGYNEGVRAQRNLIASNLGLLAKADTQGKLTVSVTNLATAQPVSGVTLQLRNYQNQPVGSGSTDGDGMATLVPSGTPYLLVAENGKDRGYLRLNTSGALPVSHFEVGGETIQKGLKGAIYGERGVWRPGDAMPLTFVVYDREKTLPENHPATLELRDPRGRVVQTLVNAKPVDGFYRFDAHTAADAPTGNWSAKVSLGGASFTRALKVETVMPNRLKVTLDLGTEILGAGRPIAGKIDSEWLSGASAAGLKTDVNLRLSATRTRFTGFDNYVFDDPAREYRAEPEEIFAGDLDANASVRFEKKLDLGDAPPGMLAANFTTRVFERGGAFSIQYDARDYAPYERFVGLKLPTAKRDTLQVDEDHTVDIASVTARGAAVANRKLSVKLYKIDWRWWWDRGNDSLASYVTRESSTRVREGTVTTNAQGKAQWQFRVGQSQWGRYLLRVCDEEGGHCTGSVFYLDWPYWVGEGRDQAGPAATMLDLTADKEIYQVGDTAVVQLPQSAQGRALVTVENGSAVLAAKWITPTQQDSRVSIPITAAMTPNAYVAVTLIQPHAGKKNDRPIRLYGVLPLVVTDPATQLKPALQVADEWRPESEVSVKVSEAQGKAMTYTLAVVDEGLLSLTNFRTPDLHGEFFRREALGVRTWDLFDEVSGAYGMALERLLALGGSDGAAANAANQQQSRFPPLAQLLGPFELPAGKTQEQKVKLPRYVGAVRVMVVAGSQATKPAAYGSTEKSVRVRQPLMILPTLPRVVGPGEEITVPVSVFAMNDQIRNVQLTIAPDSNFEIVGGATTTLVFERQGEKIGLLKLRAAQKLGMAKVRFTATSGNERAQDEINIELRSPNPPSTRLVSHMLQPGEAWTAALKPHGIAGTNRVTLEVSRIPPVNLENRLEYLISYPHGCLEQTTSAVFPQLFLGSLMNLDAETLRRAEANVRAGISKLRDFQLVNGAFSYWPGGAYEASGYSQWAAIYASHFLVEAEKKGYTVPAALRAGMVRSLRAMAQSWRVTESAPLNQAYRLYVLARAGQPEVGAMNRLREVKMDGVERWVLAAAYQLAGLGDAARQLATGDPMAGRDYRADDYTFGSTLRDHALVLQSMVILNQLDRAEPLVREISKSLSGDGWYSTQETAYSLLAISQLAGARTDPGGFTYTRTVAGKSVNATSKAALDRNVLDGVPDAGTDLVLRNTSQGILFATVTLRGTPPPQAEEASAAGLEMQVAYSDVDGNPVDLAKLKQGEDIAVDITLRNTTRSRVDNIALTQIVPSGWEIRNDRLGGSDDGTGDRDADNRRQNLRNQRAARADYVDIRDDRVMQYFSLDAGATIRFQTNVNAAYRGRYYLPGIVAEAMYDATRNARSAGRWTEVVAQ
jgi:uncharacterized protein YfaS (alpha-2-macroglobulin family)